MGAAVHREVRDILPTEQDSPRCGPREAREDVEERRLASTVGPYDPKHFAARDREPHFGEDACAADRESEALDGEAGTLGPSCHRTQLFFSAGAT